MEKKSVRVREAELEGKTQLYLSIEETGFGDETVAQVLPLDLLPKNPQVQDEGHIDPGEPNTWLNTVVYKANRAFAWTNYRTLKPSKGKYLLFSPRHKQNELYVCTEAKIPRGAKDLNLFKMCS